MTCRLLIICLTLTFLSPVLSQEKKELPYIQSNFIGLYVSNFDSTLAWYTKQMGFNIIRQESKMELGLKFAMLEWNGFLIELIQNPKIIPRKELISSLKDKNDVTGFFKLGFKVDDVSALALKLKSKNITFKYPLMLNPNFGWELFIIEDPEGNWLQFYSDKK